MQLQSFLSVHSFKSAQDFEYITAICGKNPDVKIDIPYEIDPEKGVSLTDFTQWLESGFGCGDVAKLDDTLVICGICRVGCARIVGKLSDDKILYSDEEVAQNALKTPKSDEYYYFLNQLRQNKLQFGYRELKLIPKYVPQPGERVIFSSSHTKGLGVVKDVNKETGEITMFCYYIYGTKQCGYSMHETGICTLDDFVFEPMTNDQDKRQTKMNGIACRRRLNRELERHGKIWNEKLHRVEPTNPTVEIGQPYWYINDKLTLLKDTENGKATARQRYYAGNYFRTEAEGVAAMGRVAVLLREILAEDNPLDKRR